VSTATVPASADFRRSAIRMVPEPVRRSLPLLATIIAVGIFSASQSEKFLTTVNLQNILAQGSVLGLLTVGMTILMMAGLLDLSVGTLTSLVAVIAAQLAGDLSDPLIILVAVAVGVAASALTGSIIAAVRVAPFILTLGGLSVFLSLGLILSKGLPIPVPDNNFSVLGLGKWFGIPASGVLFLVAAVIGALLMRYAKIGRNGFALGSNPEAAFLSGVRIVPVTVGLFALSGACVGVAGIVMLGRFGAGDANAGMGLELQAIAAAVLGGSSLSGGKGSMWGSVLGVVLLVEIANSLTLLGVQSFYQNLAYGLVLIVAVVATALRERPPGARTRRRSGPTQVDRQPAATSGGEAS
jgi:ribose/xylose/arabinose/galactoside ABC-type transport system permease subunit